MCTLAYIFVQACVACDDPSKEKKKPLRQKEGMPLSSGKILSIVRRTYLPRDCSACQDKWESAQPGDTAARAEIAQSQKQTPRPQI